MIVILSDVDTVRPAIEMGVERADEHSIAQLYLC